eukprot:TRINITY_DN360_c3_g1_i1.p1 TRINITY_DN360_c3_g1~~TRINITY_DN360_c3_g1_i1.p1  ORF type:complete len:425 (-),score=33.74 TRINITY_DN360_c3_g1_i1:140-1414(-)
MAFSALKIILVFFVTFIFCERVVYQGIPNDFSSDASWYNGKLLNTTFSKLNNGDTFIIPNSTYYVMGGIKASNLSHIVIQIDGTIVFSTDMNNWPTDSAGNVFECFQFDRLYNVTFTSSGIGLLDGNGAVWWGIPGLGYVERGENRPRLMNIGDSKNILVEYIHFLNSPYWTFWAHGIDGLEVRFSHVVAKRDDYDGHDLIDLSAFNTDGFDVSGKNVWIHHCSVWNQDDCFCVKDDSENMLFEELSASGLGLTVGSIGGSSVRNITFRNVYMPQTYKGIYMKFRAEGGLITDVLYENIVMDQPEQWPIWIGPAQQADSSDLCAAHPCSICWPDIPFTTCNPVQNGIFANITLRNITINGPAGGAGVIIGSSQYPMQNIVFDQVNVYNPPEWPYSADYYACEGVGSGSKVSGSSWPVPSCFPSN